MLHGDKAKSKEPAQSPKTSHPAGKKLPREEQQTAPRVHRPLHRLARAPHYANKLSAARDSTLVVSDIPTNLSRMKSPAATSADPDILGGDRVFAGTRVPVRSLFDHLEAGDSIGDFLDGFPSVTREQVIAVLAESRAHILQSA